MSNDATLITDEEMAAFVAICPSVDYVKCRGHDGPASFGVAARFSDGLQHGVKFRTGEKGRAEMLRLAALKLRDWHKMKTAA